jgi:hypothetical protein
MRVEGDKHTGLSLILTSSRERWNGVAKGALKIGKDEVKVG